MADGNLRQVLTRGGTAVVLASAGYMGFLHKWEDGSKQRNVVYADKLADGLPTACGGITKHTSPVPVVVGDYWSDQKCAEIQALVAAKGQIKLADCITGPVTQNAFDAFSSHAHNFGVGETCASRAMGLLNAGMMDEACRAISRAPDGKPVWSSVTTWVKTGKTLPDGKPEVVKKLVFVQGLYNRRLDETALCLRPDKPEAVKS